MLRQFGVGSADLINGPAGEAAFNRPHGMVLERETLYVADTGNHAVRRIDALKAEDPMIARDLDVLLRKLRG